MRYPNTTSLYFATPLGFNAPTEGFPLDDRQNKTKTNVYCNYGSQKAGLVKHRLHTMNSIGMWYNKTREIKYALYNTQFTTQKKD